MDSLSIMLDRLRINDYDFKERFINITSVYNAPFDSDTILKYLKEGTLREGIKGEWIVDIPPIAFNIEESEYIIPSTVTINLGDRVIEEIPMPETIEEFRAFAKSKGIEVKLNTETAILLYA